MKWYKKALFGASLVGLASLGGCKDGPLNKPVKPETNLKLSNDGYDVSGKIDDMRIQYYVFENGVTLNLRKDSVSKVRITDGGRGDTIDGNLNYFFLVDLAFQKHFFCDDNGNKVYKYLQGLPEEEVKKLRQWGNEKLKEVYEICKEKFGDKLKIPYKAEKVEESERDLDEVLKDFNF